MSFCHGYQHGVEHRVTDWYLYYRYLWYYIMITLDMSKEKEAGASGGF